MEQIRKNTVQGTNQLTDGRNVRFENVNGTGIRVLFVGNSITLHDVKPDLGWNMCHGMAASSKDKDYVHVCIREIQKVHPDAVFGISNVAEWEVNYKNGETQYSLYEKARDFHADVIIMRVVENCPIDQFDDGVFQREYGKFLDYLNSDGKAFVVITTGFWKHPADEAIKDYAESKNYPCCELGDLGELDEMKAVGLFEHSGVAAHPGDLGMKTIADRIMKEVLPKLRGM